jgi:hypothetical protein
MSAPGAEVVEVVRIRSVLGVAFHDLLTDARIVEGLRVTAWPATGGRATPAFQTASGAYAFRGLEGMRQLELPDSDHLGDPELVDTDLDDTEPRRFVVQVVDRRGRYLDTVLVVDVPTMGLVTQGDILDTAHNGSHDRLPIYLFSAPTRAVPTHVAVIRGQVADHTTGAPVPWCRVDVVVDPDGQPRRSSGIADAGGNVLVTVPYPRFGPPAGADEPSVPGEGARPAAGTQGTPMVERSWPATVSVRCEPDRLEQRPGARAPALDRILGQGPTDLWATNDGPPGPSLSTELHHGADLILRTDGDQGSRLLIERPST